MLYIVKFFYQWLLPPACFVLALALLCVWMFRRRSKGRFVLLALTVMLYLFSLRPVAGLLVWPLERWVEPPAGVSGDVLLMLGNGSVADAPDIDGMGQPSGTMGKNMLMTARLQRTTGLPILVSGGTVFADSGTEADIALREFEGLGIPRESLYGENQSRNTVENARFSKEICDAHGWKKPVVLVVALQAKRTAMIFEREGFDAVIYPTHFRMSRSWHFHPVLDLIPSGAALHDSSDAMKEYLGMLALLVRAQ